MQAMQSMQGTASPECIHPRSMQALRLLRTRADLGNHAPSPAGDAFTSESRTPSPCPITTRPLRLENALTIRPDADDEQEEDRVPTPRWWKVFKQELVFGKEDRGLPSLDRGWRTPDPSPSRGRSLLRKVCEKEEEEEEVEVNGGASTTADETAPELPRGGRLRTPSPEPSNRYCFPCDGHSALAAAGPQSPYPPAAALGAAALPTPGSVGHPHSCAMACKYKASSRGCKDGFACDHCHLCKWKRPTRGMAMSELSHRGGSMSVEWPSRGSSGHPRQCAAACKYVRKKHGCRDGADCPQCHLCWHKRASKACACANTGHQAQA
mmetsp:Transcript_81898/g.211002  ORF Transcript_81898/g.211002 Transcript_81898/m.211002 type:complete len:323 (+) Transcript_81898:47-1015(+)